MNVNQPTLEPTQKMSAVGLAGAVTVVLVWGVNLAFGIDIPGHVAAAITLILGFGAGYMTPERASR